MKLSFARFMIVLWGLLLGACSGNGITDVKHEGQDGEDHESHSETHGEDEYGFDNRRHRGDC